MHIRNVALKEYSSLRTGGEGSLVEVRTVEELKEAIMHARSEGLQVHILGGGTNSYFGSDLSKFLFIKPEFSGIELQTGNDGRVTITAGSSENWDEVVQLTVHKNLWGIENLSHIPGTVGAAPVQNIGAYGVELAEVFGTIQALDTETLEIVEFAREDCRFGYRDSVFKYQKGRYVILSVSLTLYTEPHPVLIYKPLDALQGKEGVTPQVVRDMVIKTRNEKLPDWKERPNAGSFFKNPVVDLETSEHLKNLYEDMPLIQVPDGYKIPAAWLIDRVAGMKGVRTGDVGTWPAQPLVIVNYGDATADDVDDFAKEIRSKIHKKTGIVLEQEVNRIG